MSSGMTPVLSCNFSSLISSLVALANLSPCLTLQPGPLEAISCCHFRMTKLLQLCLVIESDAHLFCWLWFSNCVQFFNATFLFLFTFPHHCKLCRIGDKCSHISKTIRSQKILLPHNRNKESLGTKMY